MIVKFDVGSFVHPTILKPFSFLNSFITNTHTPPFRYSLSFIIRICSTSNVTKNFAMRFHVLLKVNICASSSCLGVLYQMIFASFEGHLRRPQICATCFTSHRIIEFFHFHGHLDFPTVFFCVRLVGK